MVAIPGMATVTATAAVPHLAWGGNTASITLQGDETPHVITINIHARNEDAGGIGWDTTHQLAAGERMTIAREFYIRPLPGRADVTLIVKADSTVILERRFNDRFRAGHAPMNRLHITSTIWRSGPLAVPDSVSEYPALQSIVRPPLVFYVLPDDKYAKRHVQSLWRKRTAALHRLNAKLGTAQAEPIAFYLFPDAATKFAYMFHRGAGWAVGGHAIVEIFNAKQHLDPNHELAHVVTSLLGQPPALFNEGLATYLQAGGIWDGRPVDSWVRTFARSGRLVSIDALMRFTDIGSEGTEPEVTYPEAGSFVKFLDQRYGTRAVLSAFESLKSSDIPLWQQENEAKFASIFGCTPAAAERSWLRSLGIEAAK